MNKAFDPNIPSKSLTEAVVRLLYSITKLVLVLFLVFGTLGYLLPTALAVANERKDTLSIFFWNLLSGWTVIGWVLTFLWARK
jgi:hypothetical protein